MERKSLILAITIVSCILLTPLGLADEPVYGYQLMSEQERAEHRAKMRSFQTEQEREAYRKEHHKMMQERAKARGVTLPDEPVPRSQGKGMGKGQGMGQGQGYRGGQGQGQSSATESKEVK